MVDDMDFKAGAFQGSNTLLRITHPIPKNHDGGSTHRGTLLAGRPLGVYDRDPTASLGMW